MNDGYIKWYGKVIDRDKVVNTKRMQREHVTKLHALRYAFLTYTLVKWLTGYPDIDISTDTIQVKITFSDKVVLNKTNDSWKNTLWHCNGIWCRRRRTDDDTDDEDDHDIDDHDDDDADDEACM